jgi:hypothetical protein
MDLDNGGTTGLKIKINGKVIGERAEHYSCKFLLNGDHHYRFNRSCLILGVGIDNANPIRIEIPRGATAYYSKECLSTSHTDGYNHQYPRMLIMEIQDSSGNWNSTVDWDWAEDCE